MDGMDLEAMTHEELERTLQSALEELDEVKEMRQAVLGQSGVHIGFVRLKQFETRFASDQKRLEERIAQIRARLEVMEEGPAQ